jgi:hypothetical protein
MKYELAMKDEHSFQRHGAGRIAAKVGMTGQAWTPWLFAGNAVTHSQFIDALRTPDPNARAAMIKACEEIEREAPWRCAACGLVLP